MNRNIIARQSFQGIINFLGFILVILCFVVLGMVNVPKVEAAGTTSYTDNIYKRSGTVTWVKNSKCFGMDVQEIEVKITSTGRWKNRTYYTYIFTYSNKKFVKGEKVTVYMYHYKGDLLYEDSIECIKHKK